MHPYNMIISCISWKMVVIVHQVYLQTGKYLTIAEGGDSNSDESTGLAFCDKGRRMIFAFQDEGKVFEVMVS